LLSLTFGDSDGVAIGDGVLAIGSPYGLSETLTTGIVSALDRTITAPSGATIGGAIQTDTSINPGNSGGPLLDADGDVVGVKAQIESDSGGNTGVGFAIPADTVKGGRDRADRRRDAGPSPDGGPDPRRDERRREAGCRHRGRGRPRRRA